MMAKIVTDPIQSNERHQNKNYINVSPFLSFSFYSMEFQNGWFDSLNCHQNTLSSSNSLICSYCGAVEEKSEVSVVFQAEEKSDLLESVAQFFVWWILKKSLSDSIHSAQLESVIIIYTFPFQNSWEMDARLLRILRSATTSTSTIPAVWDNLCCVLALLNVSLNSGWRRIFAIYSWGEEGRGWTRPDLQSGYSLCDFQMSNLTFWGLPPPFHAWQQQTSR